jgi:predicted Zn-dependent protease
MRERVGVIRDWLKRRGWIALAASLIVMGAVSLPLVWSSRFVSQRRAALHLKQAASHLASGEYDLTRGELRAVLRLHPRNAEARRQLAAMELGLGNWEVSFLEFQSLTELHPEDPNGWVGLADLMVRSGLLEAPEDALNEAIEAAPTRADARRLRGEIRFNLGRYHGAQLDAQAAVAQAPKDAASWALLVRSTARSLGATAGIEAANRGIAAVGREPALLRPLAFLLAEQGRTREAMNIPEEIIATNSDADTATNAQITMVRVRMRSGDRDGARRQLDEVLLQHPVQEEAVALRAVIEATAGRVDASLSQLNAALELQPTSRTLRDVHARVQSARNDSRAIAALLAETVARDLGPPPAAPSRVRAESETRRSKFASLTREHWPGRMAQMRQVLETQLRQKNWNEAQRIVGSARQLFPDTAFGPFVAGILEFAGGNAEGAQRQFFEALTASPASPVVIAALAKAWSRRKGAAFAAEQLMRLADREPELAFARYMAARAYVDGRDPVKAEAALSRGLELQPNSTIPYLHLADHYVALDRTADALGICQQGLDRFPQDLDLQLSLAEMTIALGRANDAIPIYEEILSRRPDLDLVRYKLAMLLASNDVSPQRALQIVQPLQADRPSDPLLLDTLGWVHYRTGDTTRARELLQAAVSGAPEEPTLRFHLAALYAREKKTDLARRELKAAVDSNRSFPERLDAMRLLRESSSAAVSR